jgi:hypothetical protein
MTNNGLDPAALQRFTEAQRLAEQQLGRCHGKCKRVLPFDDLVTTVFRGTVAIALCPDCFDYVDLVTTMTPEGLSLKIIRKQSIAVVG